MVSLDAIAADPATAMDLSTDDRRRALTQCAAVLAALSSKPDAASDRAEQYVEAKTIAGMLSVSESYVYELIRKGQLPAISFGKYRRVSLAAFDEWAARQEIAVDPYATYSIARDDRRRAPGDSRAPRPDATGVRRARGGHAEQRRTVGARGDGDSGISGAPSSNPR